MTWMFASSSRSTTSGPMRLWSQAAAFAPTAIAESAPRFVRRSTLAVLGMSGAGLVLALSRLSSCTPIASSVLGGSAPLHAPKQTAPTQIIAILNDFIIGPFRRDERTAARAQPRAHQERRLRENVAIVALPNGRNAQPRSRNQHVAKK